MGYSGGSKRELINQIEKLKIELAIKEKKLLEEAENQKKISFQLTERKKELNCHNHLSQIFSSANPTTEELITKVLHIIPPSWQFPDLTEAFICIKDVNASTPGYKPSKYELYAPIFSHKIKIGDLIVGYPEFKTTNGEDIFLAEEQTLINAIAERIGSYIQKSDTEKEKFEKDQLYKTIVDTSPDSITITDLEGTILFTSLVNDSSRNKRHKDIDSINRNIFDFIDESYHDTAKKNIHKLLNGENIALKIYEGTRPDGSRFLIEVNSNVIKNSKGEPAKMIFVSRDMSERKKIEDRLILSERRLKTMMSNLPGIAYQCLNDKNWTMLFMSKGTKALTGFASKEFTGKNSKSYNDIIHPDDRDLVTKNVSEGIEKRRPFEHEYRIITASGEIKYVWEKGQGIFDENNNLLYLEGLINDITKRTKLNLQLQEKEQKYRFLVESVNDVVYELSGDGTFIYLSPAAEHIFGYKSKEITGTKLYDYIYKEDIPLITNAFKKGLNKNYAYLDYRIYNKAGEIRWVRSSTTPIFKDKKLVGGTGILRDITEVKSAEIKLQRSEKRYRQLFELADDMVFLLDKGKFIDANPSALKKLGVRNPQELKGKTPLHVSPEYQPNGQLSVDKLIETQKLAAENGFCRFEWLFTINGENRWLDISLTLLPDSNNELTYAVCRDITTAKETETALLESQQQHNEAQQMAKLGHWKLDLIKNDLKWSDEIFRLFEIDINKFEASYDAFLHAIHPEDREIVNAAYQNSLKTKQPYDIVHRLLMKDGRIKYIREQCHTKFDEEGNPLFSLGTAMDITSQKEMELSLREKKQRFIQVTEQSQTVIWEVDKNGLYTFVSPTCEKVLGYHPEELIGKVHYFDLYPEENREDFIAATMKVFAERKTFSGLHNLIVRKDGTVITVSTNGMPFFNKNNEFKGYRGADNDITEVLNAEEKLKKSELKYRTIFESIQDTYYEITMDGIIAEISPSVQTLSRGLYKRDELIGKSLIEMYADLNRREEFFAALQKNGKVSDFEVSLINKDESIIYTAITASLNFDKEGRPTKVIGTIRDNTHRRKAEEKIRQSEKLLSRAQEIANMGSWDYNIATQTTIWSANMYRLIGLAPSKKEIKRDDFISIVHPDDKHLFYEFLPDIRQNKKKVSLEFRIKINEEYHWMQTIISPVLKKGELVSLNGINIDINEKKKAEKEIFKINHRLNAILNALPDLLFIIDKNGVFIDFIANEDADLAMPRDQIIGANISSIFPPEQVTVLLNKVNECLKQQQLMVYNHPIELSGQIRFYESRLTPFTSNSVIILTHDVTEKRKNELTITTLSKAIEQSPIITVITDLNGTIEFVNEAFTKVTGYTTKEAIGKNSRILKSGKTPKAIYKKLWETILDGGTWTGEWINKKKNGEYYWENVTIAPIKDIHGKHVSFLAIKQDITERKKQETEIKELNKNLEKKVEERTVELKLKTQELEEFFAVSPDLLCIADLNGNFIKVNTAWEKFLGFSRKEIENKNFISFIHPEDILAANETIKKLKKNREVVNFINRYKTGNGEYRFIEWRAILSNDLFYTAAHDVTEQKLKENIESELLDLSIQLSGVAHNEINNAVNNALKRVGKFIDTDRAYIFEFDDEKKHMSNTFEWCNKGISQEIDNLQNLSTSLFPAWVNTLKQHKNVIIPLVSQLSETWEAERKIMEAQDIQSVLAIPMFIENNLLGFIGLDSVNRIRTFSPYEIQTLNIWVNILTSLINRRNAGAIIEQTRQNYETFFNTIDDFLFIFNMEGNIVSINNTITNRLGYTLKELQDKPIFPLLPKDRRKEAKEIFEKMLKGETDHCSIPLLTKTGEQIMIETKVKQGLWNGEPCIFSVSKDVSDIVISEQKFSKAFHSNASLMTIFRFDDQIVIDVNEMFLNAMEFSRHEIIGKKYFELNFIVDLDKASKLMVQLGNDIPIREEEVELRTKSGIIRTILLSADTVYIAGDRCILAVMIDLTQRKQMEADLLKAKLEAEEANKAKSEFLSRMSHELRTPMNSILGFAQLLDLRATDKKQKKGINRILNGGKHLLSLINEVLEISRIESGRLALSIEPVNVYDVLDV